MHIWKLNGCNSIMLWNIEQDWSWFKEYIWQICRSEKIKKVKQKKKL